MKKRYPKTSDRLCCDHYREAQNERNMRHRLKMVGVIPPPAKKQRDAAKTKEFEEQVETLDDHNFNTGFAQLGEVYRRR